MPVICLVASDQQCTSAEMDSVANYSAIAINILSTTFHFQLSHSLTPNLISCGKLGGVNQ